MTEISPNRIYCVEGSALLSMRDDIFLAQDEFRKVAKMLRGALDTLEDPEDVPAFVAAVGCAYADAAAAVERWRNLIEAPSQIAKNTTIIEKRDNPLEENHKTQNTEKNQ